MYATTILAVRRDGQVALGGDGQVTVGETIMKSNAQSVRSAAASSSPVFPARRPTASRCSRSSRRSSAVSGNVPVGGGAPRIGGVRRAAAARSAAGGRRPRARVRDLGECDSSSPMMGFWRSARAGRTRWLRRGPSPAVRRCHRCKSCGRRSRSPGRSAYTRTTTSQCWNRRPNPRGARFRSG